MSWIKKPSSQAPYLSLAKSGEWDINVSEIAEIIFNEQKVTRITFTWEGKTYATFLPTTLKDLITEPGRYKVICSGKRPGKRYFIYEVEQWREADLGPKKITYAHQELQELTEEPPDNP